jgi:hypothetical protein
MDNNPETSYQLVPDTFCDQPVTYIHEFCDGTFQKHWGPYWSRESAQAQIQVWSNWTK